MIELLTGSTAREVDEISLDHPDSGQTPPPVSESETQSDTPSEELKSALGSEAHELLQVEGRLLRSVGHLGRDRIGAYRRGAQVSP